MGFPYTVHSYPEGKSPTLPELGLFTNGIKSDSACVACTLHRRDNPPSVAAELTVTVKFYVITLLNPQAAKADFLFF